MFSYQHEYDRLGDRPPRTEPSLPGGRRWATLQAPRTVGRGRALSPTGEVGRVCSCTRPSHHRALSVARPTLPEFGNGASDAGRPDHARSHLGGTRGVSRWRATTVGTRDLRSELMLKLLFHDRAGLDPMTRKRRQRFWLALSDSRRQLASVRIRSDTRPRPVLRPSRTVVHRRSRRQPHGRAVVYRPIGYVVSPPDPTECRSNRSQTPREGERSKRRSRTADALPTSTASAHVWCSRTSTRRSGGTRRCARASRRQAAWDVRDTIATPTEPIGLSLSRIVEIEPSAVIVEGTDLLDGSPVLDLKPFVPLFDTPSGDIRFGWFEGRAERIFARTSDDRFAMRSRRPD